MAIAQQQLMTQAAYHYYQSHLTMAEIGRKPGISRHRVSRLLKAAIATGVVKIEIRSPIAEDIELRRRLEKNYNLQTALIVNLPFDIPPEQAKTMTCRAAGAFLRHLLGMHRTIGVGWG